MQTYFRHISDIFQTYFLMDVLVQVQVLVSTVGRWECNVNLAVAHSHGGFSLQPLTLCSDVWELVGTRAMEKCVTVAVRFASGAGVLEAQTSGAFGTLTSVHAGVVNSVLPKRNKGDAA